MTTYFRKTYEVGFRVEAGVRRPLTVEERARDRLMLDAAFRAMPGVKLIDVNEKGNQYG